MFKKALVLLLLLFATASISARIFKWVDEKGVTHYSESAPPKQKATELPTEPAPPETQGTGINPETLRWQRLEAEFQKRKAERGTSEDIEALKRENEQRVDEEHKKKCVRAKRDLYTLEKGKPFLTLNEKGESVYLDDKSRPEEIKKMKQQVKVYCEEP